MRGRTSLFTCFHQCRARMSMSSLSAPMTLAGSSNLQTPKLVYGTAWKKDRTSDLVYQALVAGFRGIDTAAQPRHYQERLVGDGIRQAIRDGVVKREDLYIQTKFTPPGGQDPDNMPYSASSNIEDQIHTSIASSLANLSSSSDGIAPHPHYLDTVLLHSLLSTTSSTLTAWRTLATYVQSGKIKALGIANCPLPMLQVLLSHPQISIRPSIVQNRFYPATNYEVGLRRLCAAHGIIFQSFWTLTGNPKLVKGTVVGRLAAAAGVSREVATYALVVGLENVTVLDGTTKRERMEEDLEGLRLIGTWARGEGRTEWESCLAGFKAQIGEI